MKRSFAEWVTDSGWKAAACVFLSAWLALILPFALWLPGAMVVLVALVASPVSSGYALALAGAALLGLLMPATGLWTAVLLATALLVPQYLIGRMLARGASMTVCFQFAALAALGMLVVVYGVIADPPGVWRPMLEQLAQSLDRFAATMSNASSGHRLDEQQIVDASAAHLWGAVGWLLLLNTMVSAMAGQYWAQRKGFKPIEGSSFGELSAGRTLTLVCVGCAGFAAWFTAGLGADGLMVLGGVFVLQGLSVLHAALLAWGFRGAPMGFGYAAAFLALLLVSWAVPAVALAVEVLLFLTGFLDNWWPLRTRFAKQAV